MKAIRKRSRKEPFRGVINGLVGTHRRFTSPGATHRQRHIAQTVAAVPWTDVSTAVRLAPDMRLLICDKTSEIKRVKSAWRGREL